MLIAKAAAVGVAVHNTDAIRAQFFANCQTGIHIGWDRFGSLHFGIDGVALGVYLYTRGMDTSSFHRYNGLAIVIAMYLPALWMVLRRPNEGVVPVWLERASAALPAWLRGRAPATEAAAR